MALGIGQNVVKSRIVKPTTVSPHSVIFDGVNDVIITPDADTLTVSNNFAVLFWVYMDSSDVASQNHGFLHKQREYGCGLISSGRDMFFLVEDSSNSKRYRVFMNFTNNDASGNPWAGNKFPTDAWTLVAINSSDASETLNLKLFINNRDTGGQLKDSDFEASENLGSDLLIGSADSSTSAVDAADSFAKCKITNFSIIGDTLTTTELTNIYGAGQTGNYNDFHNKSVLVYYRFFEGSGLTFEDLSGNNNDGASASVATAPTFEIL